MSDSRKAKLIAEHRLRVAMEGIAAAFRERHRAVMLAREAGLTQREIAEATGLSQPHMGNILAEQ